MSNKTKCRCKYYGKVLKEFGEWYEKKTGWTIEDLIAVGSLADAFFHLEREMLTFLSERDMEAIRCRQISQSIPMEPALRETERIMSGSLENLASASNGQPSGD